MSRWEKRLSVIPLKNGNKRNCIGNLTPTSQEREAAFTEERQPGQIVMESVCF